MALVSYKRLAKHYDLTMGDRTDAIRFLKDIISRYHPRARRVLELACGTAVILKSLEADYDVWGLDNSDPMLKVARKKIRPSKLSRQDMSQFKLHRKFDVIYCVFDSINHLLGFSDWEQVFKRSH